MPLKIETRSKKINLGRRLLDRKRPLRRRRPNILSSQITPTGSTELGKRRPKTCSVVHGNPVEKEDALNALIQNTNGGQISSFAFLEFLVPPSRGHATQNVERHKRKRLINSETRTTWNYEGDHKQLGINPDKPLNGINFFLVPSGKTKVKG